LFSDDDDDVEVQAKTQASTIKPTPSPAPVAPPPPAETLPGPSPPPPSSNQPPSPHSQPSLRVKKEIFKTEFKTEISEIEVEPEAPPDHEPILEIEPQPEPEPDVGDSRLYFKQERLEKPSVENIKREAFDVKPDLTSFSAPYSNPHLDQFSSLPPTKPEPYSPPLASKHEPSYSTSNLKEDTNLSEARCINKSQPVADSFSSLQTPKLEPSPPHEPVLPTLPTISPGIDVKVEKVVEPKPDLEVPLHSALEVPLKLDLVQDIHTKECAETLLFFSAENSTVPAKNLKVPADDESLVQFDQENEEFELSGFDILFEGISKLEKISKYRRPGMDLLCYVTRNDSIEYSSDVWGEDKLNLDLRSRNLDLNLLCDMTEPEYTRIISWVDPIIKYKEQNNIQPNPTQISRLHIGICKLHFCIFMHKVCRLFALLLRIRVGLELNGIMLVINSLVILNKFFRAQTKPFRKYEIYIYLLMAFIFVKNKILKF